MSATVLTSRGEIAASDIMLLSGFCEAVINEVSGATAVVCIGFRSGIMVAFVATAGVFRVFFSSITAGGLIGVEIPEILSLPSLLSYERK